MRKLFELLFTHGFIHLFRRTLQLAFRLVSVFFSKGSSCCFLLSFGFGWHSGSPQLLCLTILNWQSAVWFQICINSEVDYLGVAWVLRCCLLYTSPSPRDRQ